jgi:hypothetical protein
MIKSLAMLLALILALGGTVVGTTGCDALGIGKDSSKDDDGKKKKKKDDDEDDDEEADDKKKAEEKPEEPTTPASNGNIKDCPGQTKLSGTRRVLRPLSVYEATDTSSTRITGLAPGTLVNLKFQCGNWIMVDYPSGVGQMSPGWVNVAVRSTEWKVESDDDDNKKEEEKKEEKEEEKEEEKKEDPPDAGKEDPPDAGPTKIRIPKLIKKN